MTDFVEFQIHAPYALFTNPMTKTSGEKFSYPVPTYSALVGVCESIYWRPTFRWVIDSVTIVNPIAYESHALSRTYEDGTKSLATYSMLTDVHYYVRAHFEPNAARLDLQTDYIPKKHRALFEKRLAAGGTKPPFLGVRRCLADVSSIDEKRVSSYYKGTKKELGSMVHSMDYLNRTVYVWDPIMKDGEIQFLRPEQCAAFLGGTR